MPITIIAERPDTPESTELIGELEACLAPFYPPQSRHGYSVEKLLREQVAFFVVRSDGAPAGCGGVQIVGRDYGELKRMYVRPRFRRLGLGKVIVDHLESHARSRGVALLRLETGIHQKEAIGLYERCGFVRIGPFGPYRDDPLSAFYEKRIELAVS